MSNRTAKFVAAIFASILAGANFAAVAENATKPADSCLSGPKGAPSAGSHWYYHIDRATKRHCWYLGEGKDKTAAAAPPQDAAASPAEPAAAAAPPTNLVPPQANATVRKSIADAHAELPSPQARPDQGAGVNVQPGNSGAAATAAIQNSQPAVAPDAPPEPSIITSRWPDSAGVSSSNNPQIAAADPPASAPANAKAAPQPAPAASPVALAAADAPLQRQSGSTQMLLMVMAAALALAGVTASLVFRFGRAAGAQPGFRDDRRAIWDSVDTDRSSPSMFPNENVPRWRDQIARDPRPPDDPERRLKEMLARLARSETN
jgi:hypothetical protein